MSDSISVLNTQAFSLAENTDGSPDPIRNSINSYWDYNGDTLVYDTGNSYDPSERKAQTSLLNFDITADPGKINEPIKLDDDTSITMITRTQEVTITPKYPSESEADPKERFESYIENSIIPSIGSPFSEFKLDLDSPLEYASNIQNHSAIAGTVNFVYNYGLGDYENKIEQNIISESQLNNFYKVTRINRRINRNRLTKSNVSRRLIDTPVAEEEIQDFFINSSGFIRALAMQEKKDTFPFYNEVYLTNPPRKNSVDKLEESLKESGLITAFCDLMNREDFLLTRGLLPATITNPLFINSYLETSYIDKTQQQFKEQSDVRRSDIKLYDIPAMLKIMYAAIPKGEKSETSTKSAESESAQAAAGTEGGNSAPAPDLPQSPLRSKAFLIDGEKAKYRLDTISKMKNDTDIVVDYQNSLDDFVEEVNNLITNVDNFKRYRQVLEGTMKPYQSDVLFYRIKKFEQGSSSPIQNFWIPAEKGYRGVRYIDTQVKYGKMYRYEVCAYKMILGSDYEFSEQNTGVINFDQDLQDFIDASQENLENLIGLALIKPAMEEAVSQQAASIPEFLRSEVSADALIAVAVADFIEERNILDSDLVKVEGYSLIADFADKVIQGNPGEAGSATYRGATIRVDQLTEEERDRLNIIRKSWACITNFNKTEPNKLAEIEILINKVVALGNIQEKIVKAYDKKEKEKKLANIFKNIAIAFSAIMAGALTVVFAGLSFLFASLLAVAVTGATGALGGLIDKILSGSSKRINNGGITAEDLEPPDLEDLYSDIDSLTTETRAPLSKYLGGEYGIDLDNPFTFKGSDPDLPENFTTIGRREVLPLTDFDDRGEDENTSDFKKRKRNEIKSVEFLFQTRANQLATLVAEYMGCYQDFIEAASGFNVVLDYKRISKYNLQVNLKPCLKFAEMPYYSSEGMILDNPPIYPNVNVITYRGEANRLSFFMNSGQGEVEIEPISFSDEEDVFIANYRKSRKLNDFQPFLYKSDEKENLGNVFEIRRLDEKPKDYQSFREATVITTSETILTGKTIPAATFDQKIKSNKKYYYIFRAFDKRGAPSYPSGVMEIEIVENSGIIYPIIKPYEFEKPKTNTTKSLKRLLNIVPRITQVVPPADTASYGDLTTGPTTILGREAESLFGKQFKLRLTSKKTGKVVDLNVDFNATVVERSEAE